MESADGTRMVAVHDLDGYRLMRTEIVHYLVDMPVASLPPFVHYPDPTP